MLYSLMVDKSMYFISLHAECALHTYSSEFFHSEILSEARKLKGIYCKKVNADILENIYSYKYGKKDICIDFNRIEEMTENNFWSLINFVKMRFCSVNRCAYLLNVHKKIFEKMDLSDIFQRIRETEKTVSWKIGEGRRNVTYDLLNQKQESLLNERIENMVDVATEENHEKRHASVPVYLSKYINVKKMAVSDPEMARLSVYCLALKMIESGIVKDNPTENEDIRLFFHTINGGFIAVQLAELFHMDFVYLDHLGPIEDFHRKHFEKDIQDSWKYVIVSDVICLGGEVGRAGTIIEYNGGMVLGTVCLVDIETVDGESRYKRASLYTVTSEHNKVEYTIETKLCDICKRGGKKTNE